MFKKTIISLLGIFLSGNAIADEKPYSWQGAYIGGQIGASWGKGEYDDTKVSKLSGYNTIDANGNDAEAIFYGNSSNKLNGADFIGGVYVGYNFKVAEKIILGVESDIVWGGNKTNNSSRASLSENWDYYSYYNEDNNISNEVNSKYNGAVRARIGYAMDRFLPYFAAGVAFTRLTYDEKTYRSYDYSFYGQSENVSYADSSNASKTVAGYTLGFGTDYAFTDSIILRAEYRYSDFGNNSFKERLFKEDGDYNIKYKSHDIRFGVAYKF